MKKNLFSLLFIFLLLLVQNGSSQTKKPATKKNPPKDRLPSEKMIHMLGTASFTDVYCGPISEQSTTTTDPFGNTTTMNDYSRVLGISYFTLIYGFRYNMMEMNDEVAFGVSAFPSIGLGIAGTTPNTTTQVISSNYTGVFNLPVMAGMSFGAAATQGSTSPIGFFLGAGYEYNNAPMLYAHTLANRNVHTHWLNPCVSLGIKYPSRNQNYGNLHELNLKIGMGLGSQDIKTPNNLSTPYQFKTAFTFRLSYFVYLNY